MHACRLQHVHSRPRRNSSPNKLSNRHKTPSVVLVGSSGHLSKVVQTSLGLMVSRMALSLMQSGPPLMRVINRLV